MYKLHIENHIVRAVRLSTRSIKEKFNVVDVALKYKKRTITMLINDKTIFHGPRHHLKVGDIIDATGPVHGMATFNDNNRIRKQVYLRAELVRTHR